ncbi:hypothetical protein PM082_005175 [Marasmius tenuissimus]|nr:hypothetical protein PM082_005175 [Marasmius tenuissimus]
MANDNARNTLHEYPDAPDTSNNLHTAVEPNLGPGSCAVFLGLPNEIWLAVFHQIGHPTDLYSCMLACRRFSGLAIKALYRIIHYHSLASFNTLRLFSFTSRDPPALQRLAGSVRTVVLSTGGGYGPFGMNLRDWFNSNKRTIGVGDEINSPADFDHPNAWTNFFHPSFAANVTKLVFISTKVSSQFAHALGALTSLRQLYFHGSRVESLDVRVGSNLTTVSTRMQNLTDLRIWDHSWTRSILIHAHVPGRLDTIDLLLAARNLDILFIDWNTAVACNLIEKVTPAQTAFLSVTSPHLRTLHLRISIRTVEQGDKERRDFNRLGAFLRACTNLEELHLTSEIELSRVATDAIGHVALSKLKVYSGPVELLPSILPPSADALESVSIPHIPDTLSRQELADLPNLRDRQVVAEIEYRNPAADTVATIFSSIHAPNLRHLSFFCKQWHHEVLLCIAQCFKRLKTLKIGYSSGLVEEVDWISMGGVHLERLPYLSTFYLFRQEDDTFRQNRPKVPKPKVPVAGDELLSDIFAGWKKYTKSLDEVSFEQSIVWTRGKVTEGRKFPDENAETDGSDVQKQGWAWSTWRMSERHDEVTSEDNRDAEKDREVDLWLA